MTNDTPDLPPPSILFLGPHTATTRPPTPTQNDKARDLEAWATATQEPGAYDFARENEFLAHDADGSDLFAEG